MTQDHPSDTGGPSNPSSGSSGPALANGDQPGGKTIVFGCGCSNVRITGTLSQSSSEGRSTNTSSDEEALEKVWLTSGSERAKHPVYVGYDTPEAKRHSRRASTTTDDEDGIGGTDMVWRVCWLCDTKLYWVRGRRKDDPPVEDGEVTIHRYSGIIIQSSESKEDEEAHLPYSDISLPIPSSSTFGRPPQDSLPALYPPTTSSPRITTYLPRMPDPFFLPPPFIPSHPHLRSLCSNAIDYLEAVHRSAEDDIQNYIASKSREMRELEDKVRGEVEVMWDRYVSGPGREEVQERERRRSESLGPGDRKRDRSKSSSISKPVSVAQEVFEQPSESPIPRDNLQSSLHGASLLSASISQMSYMPIRPAIPTSDDMIQETAKNFDKKGDLRAMAMSYVLSNMPGFVPPKEDDRAVEDVHGKDSWIDEERNLAKRMEGMGARGGTRPETVKEQEEVLEEKETSRKGKERVKGKVSFEVPVKDGQEDQADDEDYVFDFELEDRAPVSAASNVDVLGTNPDIARSRNIVEETLSSTYASHAPSHRSAHRQSKHRADLYAPLRRRNTDDELDSIEGEGAISKLATSVPVAIALPGPSRPTSLYPFERKTSLSDREGILVPPLIKAMRQRGILAEGNSLGLSSSPLTLSGGNQGRERAGSTVGQQSQSKFGADPGAVFESLADNQEGDGEGEEGEVGTLKEKRFVPPHVLARKESMQSKDVGWRSMAAD